MEPFSLKLLPKIKYQHLGETERRLIRPYYALSEAGVLDLLLGSNLQKEIESQVAIRSCITSQVIFLLQVYIDLLQQRSQESIKDMKVGVIGCGVVGKSILNALAFLIGWIDPSNIHISTRRPENLSKYEDIGFNIYFDNDKLIEQCDVIILCFPPSLDNWAAVELRETLQQRLNNQARSIKPFVISVVSNLYIPKLEKLLMINSIFGRTSVEQLLQSIEQGLIIEEDFGTQLFREEELVQQLLTTFQFIFRNEKLGDQFDIKSIHSSVQIALLGEEYSTFDLQVIQQQAISKYAERQGLFKQILDELTTVTNQTEPE